MKLGKTPIKSNGLAFGLCVCNIPGRGEGVGGHWLLDYLVHLSPYSSNGLLHDSAIYTQRFLFRCGQRSIDVFTAFTHMWFPKYLILEREKTTNQSPYLYIFLRSPCRNRFPAWRNRAPETFTNMGFVGRHLPVLLLILNLLLKFSLLITSRILIYWY